ncbi:MAG: YfhO family protein [Chloroflexota bacterium]|nr:YfhO family protein [Chloroflexota bacterium]
MIRRRDRLPDAAAVLLLLLLVVAFTWRIGLSGRVLAEGDIFTYFYPYWAEATRAMRVPRLPLWNPLLFMGTPFLANSQVGFFYPLNWPLWLLLPAYRSVHVTIVLHLCLAALNAYLWGRKSLELGHLGAWTVGATFALGGYLGAQVEHVNQLQGLAWLPLILMLYDHVSHSRSRRSGRAKAFAGLAVLIGLVLLAGHMQTAFISLVGLAAYGLGPTLWVALRQGGWRPVMRGTAVLGIAVAIGTALAAAQMVPTWELAQHSVRAEGLPFNERVSFSLSPFYVGRALLPRFGGSVSPSHIEYVAYVGLSGLALAVAGLVPTVGRVWERRSTAPSASQSRDLPLVFVVFVGLFFAFGVYNPVYLLLARYVSGFAHFRVPARWLALYAVGVAAFAGRAVQTMWNREPPERSTVRTVAASLLILVLWAAANAWWGAGEDLHLLGVVGWTLATAVAVGMLVAVARAPRLAVLGLLVALILELYLASLALPQSRATAPQAFTSLRPALAHLLDREPGDAGPGGRFLSMSDTSFDPGDLSLMEVIYGPQLAADQLCPFVVAAKQKEIVTPNLPLAFGVPAVDGYDGGVLPLEPYVRLQELLLSVEDVSIDGRLRENLTTVPDGRWLSLFNVQYLITDKLRDAWIDDIFYDLQHRASLSRGEEAQVPHVPRFRATSLGLVSHLEGAAGLSDGTEVGLITVAFDDGSARTFELRAGEQVPMEAIGEGEPKDLVTRLDWEEPGEPLTVGVRATLPQGTWVVRGISLIDERTGGFQSLVISDRGRFRPVHSGDVKIYENLDVLPRAFVVPRAQVVNDEQEALRAMQQPGFDPSSEVVLHEDAHSCSNGQIWSATASEAVAGQDRPPSMDATITSYRPERAVIEAQLDEPGYLVMTDAWYPGWLATVDGERAPICRADVLFRAVALDAGAHRIVFTYRPSGAAVGAAITLAALALLALVPRRICRRL